MRKSTHNWILLGIGLFACFLVMAGSILYRDLYRLFDNSSWVSHTHEVTAALEKVLTTITDAESAKRGHILSGQAESLARYNEARARYPAEIERIAELTADNAEQQSRLARLKELVAAKFDEMQRILRLFTEQGLEAAPRGCARGPIGSSCSTSNRSSARWSRES